MKPPLAIDLYCGLGGWTSGLLAAGYNVVGFDIQRHVYPMRKPVADTGGVKGGGITFCGYGTEGYKGVAFNSTSVKRMGPKTGAWTQYPAQLVLQDILTLHGSQLKDARVIVASPPCQKYSWLAMPWSKSTDPNNSKAAKALRKKWETEGPDNRLFDACFRIQREAIAATGGPCPDCIGTGNYYGRDEDGDWIDCDTCDGKGEIPQRYIPLIIENVRGAQEWVGKRDMPLDEWKKLSKEERLILGRARAKYGSFYLWGDVEQVGERILAGADIGKFGAVGLSPSDQLKGFGGTWFGVQNNGVEYDQREVNPVSGTKVPGFRFDGSGGSFQTASVKSEGIKGLATKPDEQRDTPEGTGNGSWFFGKGRKDPRDVRRNEQGEYEMPDGTKIGGDWFSDPNSTCRKHGSRSNARKVASALIAKIPAPLASYIARAFKP